MPYYAVTVQANKRKTFTKDKQVIEGFLDILKNRKEVSELSDIFYEIGKQGNHLLHTHFLMISSRPPYLKLKLFKDYMKKHGVHVDCQPLRKKLDLYRWTRYCHKYDRPDFSIETAYEDSTRPIQHRIV